LGEQNDLDGRLQELDVAAHFIGGNYLGDELETAYQVTNG
jgi:hypothetical protein